MNANMNSSRVCVDASLALAWLFFEEHHEQADELLKVWARDAIELVAPPLFHAEVTTSIRKKVYFKRILPEEGERLFMAYSSMPVRVVDSAEMYRTAWQLAKEFDLPVCYDMQYLAVAELENCEFWTLDRKLVNAVRGKNKRVRWVGEYKTNA
ncbi:MAG: type II toxin-antitoxin system VapC family toxin [Candidatus Tectomicrobia bacterium]|uniref:Type II toxin-antitoxin system VapC family toxin n=1 Tax=Tectimicrobiota bacterium TaxID=2528274 RepID=A0A933GN37_UNCTE|nr:type II toxin-antitoxin system VapC family toxin [Candidatus Tectomicrobia bacterium]